MSQATASSNTTSQVTVLRAESTSSLQSLNTITNAIRNRAAQLAQSGGSSSSGTSGTSNSGSGNFANNQSGSSNDATRNWLQAERDLFNVPEATLSENDQQFNIAVAAAGCDSSDLEVIATSNSVIVRSTSGGSNRTGSGPETTGLGSPRIRRRSFSCARDCGSQ